MSLCLVNRFGISVANFPQKNLAKVCFIACRQINHQIPNKHKDTKFRNLRRLKVMSVDPIPKLKPMIVKDGSLDTDYWYVKPHSFRVWNERDVYISTTNQVLEQYVPPEDDVSRTSLVERGKIMKDKVKDAGKDKLSLRKIRQFERDFTYKMFIEEAKEVYIAAHECLASGDLDKLTDYVTELARTTMLMNTYNQTIRWKYLNSLEEPRVVQARTLKMDGDDDVFAQITLRLHSQQVLAVYDRFGRLIYGSEILAKDVLEYVVFEKHLSNEYGSWRVHAKIIPDCLIQPPEHTYLKPEDEDEERLSSSEAPVEAVELREEKSPPAVATS